MRLSLLFPGFYVFEVLKNMKTFLTDIYTSPEVNELRTNLHTYTTYYINPRLLVDLDTLSCIIPLTVLFSLIFEQFRY